MTKPIPTQERVQFLFHYDQFTGMLTWKNPPKQKSQLMGARAGGLNQDGYRRIRVDGFKYMSGAVAWLWMTGEWPENEIDHKNLVRDDDVFDNLRKSTRSQNCINKARYYRSNRYGFRGVKRQPSGRFTSVVTLNQEDHCLGTYDTVEAAARAYDAGARRYHGEFARLNFPEVRR